MSFTFSTHSCPLVAESTLTLYPSNSLFAILIFISLSSTTRNFLSLKSSSLSSGTSFDLFANISPIASSFITFCSRYTKYFVPFPVSFLKSIFPSIISIYCFATPNPNVTLSMSFPPMFSPIFIKSLKSKFKYSSFISCPVLDTIISKLYFLPFSSAST